jgi:hypothetical protein
MSDDLYGRPTRRIPNKQYEALLEAQKLLRGTAVHTSISEGDGPLDGDRFVLAIESCPAGMDTIKQMAGEDLYNDAPKTYRALELLRSTRTTVIVNGNPFKIA